MTDNKRDNATAEVRATADRADENTNPELQSVLDEAEKRGFLGEVVDETPREHYTLPGVVAGKPTPETSK
jgi:hypothetical protein